MSLSPRGSWHRHGERPGLDARSLRTAQSRLPGAGDPSGPVPRAPWTGPATRPAPRTVPCPSSVHVGDCYAAAKQRRPVGRDEARRLRASGARACSQGLPDTALGTSATLRSL
ncbi:DUF6233 domain-containing protein [Streptomyces sp. IB201691-2A2]|uniref:DUF6233 domain-containing protein n=1 Tax=Streptomyces sp. IB201691-2A2 TaxID=2561920 RepID=UPI001CA61763|nr:DUF6233 domain-containing protein [Streptomyces sp. IB201691-2A2]